MHMYVVFHFSVSQERPEMAAHEEHFSPFLSIFNSIYALFFRKEVHLRHLRTFLHYFSLRSMEQHEIQ